MLIVNSKSPKGDSHLFQITDPKLACVTKVFCPLQVLGEGEQRGRFTFMNTSHLTNILQ